MYRYIIMCITLFLSTGCVMAEVNKKDSAKQGTLEKLPDDVTRYYDGYNYLALFTTKGERRHINKFFESGIKLDYNDSARLAKAVWVMKFLINHEKWEPKPKSAIGQATRYRLIKGGYYIIRKIELHNKNRVRLKVVHTGISQKDNYYFINEYEKNNKDLGKKVNKKLNNIVASGVEIHDWAYTGSKWMRQPLRYILCK